MNDSDELDYVSPKPIATAEQFKKALLAVRDRDGISQQELAMLRAHCRAPDHMITATQLAQALGLSSHGVANLLFGKFGHAVADRLRYAPIKRDNGTDCWWFTLAYGTITSAETEKGREPWILRPELVQALQEMKWA